MSLCSALWFQHTSKVNTILKVVIFKHSVNVCAVEIKIKWMIRDDLMKILWNVFLTTFLYFDTDHLLIIFIFVQSYV
jgi:hypothetical protein